MARTVATVKRSLKKVIGLVIGALMVIAGALWTGQGLGYIGGSSMTGNSTYAVIGPILAGVGVALLYVVIRNPNRR